ncbi:gas vesicle protein [Bacillus tianshenii]|uniref:Gas vesicle protein n=1 Tax=Sutcliffiella tianshenii TaxID=1463404 RepID=A0ABS2P219_9BACI|nr:YtxH domain-containing protein [Bacillus tianshenii]MBM7620768.1 gas vesicle protein [Bacillus tianshenii]
MNGKSFIYGVIIGGAVAGVSTLLTTPTSGEKMRNRLRSTQRKIQLSINELKDEAMGIKDQVSQAVEESKTVVTTLSNDLKTSVELWQNSIKPHQDSIQQSIALVEKELEKLERNLGKKAE